MLENLNGINLNTAAHRKDNCISSAVLEIFIDSFVLLFHSNGAILVYDITDEDSFVKVGVVVF